MKPVKKLTVSAILTALCTVVLTVGSFVPSVKISFVALAALLPAVAVIHCGYVWATCVYFASGFLALALLPDKSCAVWFLIVLGHYGITKSLIEKCGKLWLEWVLKILLFACCIAVIYFLLRTLFFALLPEYGEWILFAGLLICFVIYDIAFTALISVYCRRIKPYVD